jgi:type IV pilus assembly protein PilE
MPLYGIRSIRLASQAKGFTLIEVMIVVVVLAILMAVAYPSYQDHLRKGRRADAQTFMTEVANRQNQFLLDNRNYAVNIADMSVANALTITTPATVSRYYVVSVGPAAVTVPPSFTITATPVAGSTQVSDGVLTLTHEGAKTRNGQPGW